ncbi:hypothetical protein RB12200 [Rhodopirellula baltica SH 1]|uniref:Uncharacterized protein n=1 Tax=Rhodopirellula baltica (strain DSM 10527 / NCIMB 13988 / SH1) TaxID=243090 RepID=Q7UJ15_RHOBA|nr:hypothetical protein RB12200 [Rhodopirellula baltica SH 1]
MTPMKCIQITHRSAKTQRIHQFAVDGCGPTPGYFRKLGLTRLERISGIPPH